MKAMVKHVDQRSPYNQPTTRTKQHKVPKQARSRAGTKTAVRMSVKKNLRCSLIK